MSILNASAARMRTGLSPEGRSVAAWIVILLLLGTSPLASRYGLDAGAAHAQIDRHEPDRARESAIDRPSSGSRATDLPGWARPQERGRRSTGETSPGLGGVQPRTEPIPPGANRNVPLGGLEWLFLAGAGYAVYRLRGEDAPSVPG
jgi:hypothetical protein